MAQKKLSDVAEEIDDIKVTLDFLKTQLTEVKEQQIHILDLVKEVQSLRIQNVEMDTKIVQLVADLEQYSRMNDIIITGLTVKP